jgi:hypothetical protein
MPVLVYNHGQLALDMLQDDEKLMVACKDWGLILLNQLGTAQRAKMLFIWWRVWHMRNNIIYLFLGMVNMEWSNRHCI